MAEDDAITANDIGEAIRRGVALLEQQSVPAPTFKLRRVLDVYEEGIRAAKSRAPANRIRQAWVGAAGELPPPMPATVERALEELDSLKRQCSRKPLPPLPPPKTRRKFHYGPRARHAQHKP